MNKLWIILAMVVSWSFGYYVSLARVVTECTVDNEFSLIGQVFICAPLIPSEFEKEPQSYNPKLHTSI